jgi:hypothetical protein
MPDKKIFYSQSRRSSSTENKTMHHRLVRAPGPVGRDSKPASKIVSRMPVQIKLREAILRARFYLAPEVGDKLLALVSPEALAMIAGTATLWAAGHFFGVSEAVDVVLLGVAAYSLGSEAITAGKEMIGFVKDALYAQTDADLDRAGKHLARFVSIVGVDVAIALLMRKAAKSLPTSVKLKVELRPRVTGELKVTPRPERPPLSGGTSGELVKTLNGAPNSVLKGAKPRIYITNAQGQVILDITPERVKAVDPGVGFVRWNRRLDGKRGYYKRSPTPEELNLIKLLWESEN